MYITIAMLFPLLSFNLPEIPANPVDDNFTIRFELEAPNLPAGTKVFITGNDIQLGNWHPGKIRMESVGDDRWQFAMKARRGQEIEYKYTLGNWSQEGALPDGSPMKNLMIKVTGEHRQKDSIHYWTQPSKSAASMGVTGQLKYHRQLSFPGLLPRDIVVWLPPDYEQSKRSYDVLFMHDGQNLFDPQTSAFGVDWGIDETLDRLIREQSIRPIICVGIYNTPQRSRDYLPGKQGDLYIQFVCQKVIPFIRKRYRINKLARSAFIGGSSNGGICAFRCAWENPTVFSAALCFSPAFKFEQDGKVVVNYTKELKNSSKPDKPIPFFFVANGDKKLDTLLQPGINETLAVLQAKGLKPKQNYFWKRYDDADHNEAAWSIQFAEAAKLLFKVQK